MKIIIDHLDSAEPPSAWARNKSVLSSEIVEKIIGYEIVCSRLPCQMFDIVALILGRYIQDFSEDRRQNEMRCFAKHFKVRMVALIQLTADGKSYTLCGCTVPPRRKDPNVRCSRRNWLTPPSCPEMFLYLDEHFQHMREAANKCAAEAFGKAWKTYEGDELIRCAETLPQLLLAACEGNIEISSMAVDDRGKKWHPCLADMMKFLYGQLCLG